MADVLIVSSLITSLENVIVAKHAYIVTENIISQFSNILLMVVILLLLAQHSEMLVLFPKLRTLVLVQCSRMLVVNLKTHNSRL